MRKSKAIGILKIAGVAILVIGILSGFIIYPYATHDIVQFTVKDKERITKVSDGSSSSYYLIFTDEETFMNADSLMYLKYNSSDVYGQLAKGESFEAEVYGWRIPWMSGYRNIISVKRLN